MNSPYFNLKRKLLFSLYIYPLLMGAFILVAKLTFWPSINWFVVPATWGGILFLSLLVQKRYITSFQLSSDKLQITYLTPVFAEKVWCIELHLITDIKIDKGFLGGFGTLDIITKRKWHSFDIYSNAIADDVTQKLHSAKISFTE